ncbi:MAG TPA: SDR family NAD(P)-dependent oxidoreductase [Polyangiaceae bacterium LLY-WYZ-15_(1-7)]|nr:SDR family NAD(P)-dependent oxidoreductase [Polyangiaceae bacterium LLY-WYZ-15_(1-7)]HJL01204.1 SDR family NAD(P)-dependent oxidoreductase [Polyangiaceae bacterium LLY-WYZ-15_(1-7)]HJL10055.1 SDR family NAD(P)-dependent oxidoreductase [Polyangiaceae bacterium LLY-WYZ-15_(1-7)]HJL24268.1 SDR family NAD(P)-dependent oxidoreductase [Polyangiaceae bacterium LLY-WYZ-15_(1-7)]HJL27856.1 SDR family NAD(P)-dependent oxidoreductase [Polyangiaceae bacterium LLY-WYZ-15_(1-7)]
MSASTEKASESGMERWQGKVALVTGASSGIGTAVARALGGAGMKVALAARRKERLEALAAELPEALVVPTDLRDAASIDGLFEAVRERWGGVDVMVNNAGLGRLAPLTSGETEAWREMLEVNVLALCVCTREAVRDMRARGDAGHVFHVSSMAGHRVPGGSGVYSATKFAVRSLTEGLRQELRELGSSIRVTAISPGFVETEFAEVYSGSKEKARETYSRFEVLQPEDVAAAIVYALGAPARVQVHDVLMRPTDQPS